MTEAYTELQENYLGKITRLNTDISNQRDQIRQKQLLLMRKKQEFMQMKIDKDNEIYQCKREIDAKSSEFASDLKTALLALQERFDFAGKPQSYDHESNEVSMLRKLDDIAAGIR